jgi:hypothetical protein
MGIMVILKGLFVQSTRVPVRVQMFILENFYAKTKINSFSLAG